LKLPSKQLKLWCWIHLKWLHVTPGMQKFSGCTVSKRE